MHQDTDHEAHAADTVPDLMAMDNEHTISPTIHMLDSIFVSTDHLHELVAIENDNRISPMIHAEL